MSPNASLKAAARDFGAGAVSASSRRPQVVIVSANLSTNCTNRCIRLAMALQSSCDVQVIGTTFGVGRRWGEGLWPPIDSFHDVPIVSVRGDYLPKYLRSILSLVRLMDCDVVIACKPRLPSFGIALIRRLFWRTPVILDIDDDELAQTQAGKRATILKKLVNATGYFWTRVTHSLHWLADAKFVVSENFRQRYGGVVVPHPVDAATFDPNRYDRQAIRAGLGIAPDRFVVGFIGTPSPQKGTDLIVSALKRISDPRLLVLIVGASTDDSYSQELADVGGNRVLLIPMQPISRLPEFLVALDIVALPQRATAETWGQMPAKLTDAMAMAKATVAAARADIPAYLADGRGITFEPDDIDAFVDAMQWFLDRPDDRRDFGIAARTYFLNHLSSDVVGKVMSDVVYKLCRLGPQ